ncbi:DUF6030 family protein [Neorhizobium sp. JUb45]|uniref:DUF6030 family protein n=1 Tax=unclassified Neorhizobium TaxID=2629175 RepID=UPI00104F2875|nr:DUF6030 family protein [Neorhizobium sp. JUb45]TCR02178.1 hypothetical protein EDF70_104459 [Neorhizobium sp. JUb45]
MIEDREPTQSISKEAVPSAAERYPQPHRGRRIVMILFVTIAICGVIVPVLLANNGRNLEIAGDRLGLPLHDWWRGKTERVPLPPQAQSAPQQQPDVTAEPVHRSIPRPALENPPSHLSPPAEAWQPEKSCNALEPGATGEKPVFLAAPDGRSECTVLIALSQAEKASSLFLQVRAAGDSLSSLRMKLNFAEDGEGGALPQKAGDLARRILAPISEDDRAYLEERMAGKQAFRTEIGDYRMTFRAEGVDNSRFNFIAVSKVREPAATAEEQGAPEAESQNAQP